MIRILIGVFSIDAIPGIFQAYNTGKNLSFHTFCKTSAGVPAFLPSSFLSAGKCVVLSFKDFLSCRPTEISENDVFLCESRYNESDKQMKKFKGLKRFSLSAKVVDDEIYYFR